jgi:alpha 1,2-mannosyltransferase
LWTPFKFGLHFILTVSHEAYGNATSISRLLGTEKTASQNAHDAIPEQYHWPDSNVTFVPNRRANATIVMLARNGDLPGVVKSLKQLEDRFNKRFRYPYVFLNEEAFTDQFKECVTLLIRVDYTPLILTALATRRAGEWPN